MATYLKFDQFVEDKNHGVHNFATDQLQVLLTNTAPTDANSVAADLTEIAYTNLSTRDITTSASAQTGGVYKLTLADLTLTASGGSVGPFRYVVIANSTPVGTPLIARFDYGSEITLAAGESLDVDFDDAQGLFQDS